MNPKIQKKPFLAFLLFLTTLSVPGMIQGERTYVIQHTDRTRFEFDKKIILLSNTCKEMLEDIEDVVINENNEVIIPFPNEIPSNILGIFVDIWKILPDMYACYARVILPDETLRNDPSSNPVVQLLRKELVRFIQENDTIDDSEIDFRSLLPSLLKIANYLEIPEILHATAQVIAHHLPSYTAEDGTLQLSLDHDLNNLVRAHLLAETPITISLPHRKSTEIHPALRPRWGAGAVPYRFKIIRQHQHDNHDNLVQTYKAPTSSENSHIVICEEHRKSDYSLVRLLLTNCKTKEDTPLPCPYFPLSYICPEYLLSPDGNTYVQTPPFNDLTPCQIHIVFNVQKNESGNKKNITLDAHENFEHQSYRACPSKLIFSSNGTFLLIPFFANPHHFLVKIINTKCCQVVANIVVTGALSSSSSFFEMDEENFKLVYYGIGRKHNYCQTYDLEPIRKHLLDGYNLAEKASLITIQDDLKSKKGKPADFYPLLTLLEGPIQKRFQQDLTRVTREHEQRVLEAKNKDITHALQSLEEELERDVKTTVHLQDPLLYLEKHIVKLKTIMEEILHGGLQEITAHANVKNIFEQLIKIKTIIETEMRQLEALYPCAGLFNEDQKKHFAEILQPLWIACLEIYKEAAKALAAPKPSEKKDSHTTNTRKRKR